MQGDNKSTNLTLIKSANYIYMVAVVGYVMYSLITQTGLCGYLMDAQLRWFGVAYEKFTALIAIIILAPPGVLISKYIKSKESSAVGAIINPAPGAVRPQTISWKSLLIMSVVPALIALPAYYVLTWMDQKDQQREIYKVDLSRESAIPSDEVKFVQLTGVIQLDYQYELKRERGSRSTGKTNTYAPLTGSGWSSERPVRFFINTTFSGYDDPQTGRPGVLPERGAVAATFDGQLTRNDLPTFVESEYKRAGLRIESPYFVLDRMSFRDGRIPSATETGRYYVIPILGVGLSIAILVGGSIGLAIRKSRRVD
jgi:hypothetical protein